MDQNLRSVLAGVAAGLVAGLLGALAFAPSVPKSSAALSNATSEDAIKGSRKALEQELAQLRKESQSRSDSFANKFAELESRIAALKRAQSSGREVSTDAAAAESVGKGESREPVSAASAFSPDGALSPDFLAAVKAAQEVITRQERVETLAKSFDIRHMRLLTDMQRVLKLSPQQEVEMTKLLNERREARVRVYSSVLKMENESEAAFQERVRRENDVVDQAWRDAVARMLDSQQLALFQDEANRLDVEHTRSRIRNSSERRGDSRDAPEEPR